MKSSVDFEAVTPVPVSAFLYELVCGCEVRCEEVIITEEEAKSDEGEGDINS